jgi:hypothetical protein
VVTSARSTEIWHLTQNLKGMKSNTAKKTSFS